MTNNVLVFAEQKDGKFKKAAFEAVREGARLAAAFGGKTVAVVLGGPGVKSIAAQLASYGADRALVAESEELSTPSDARYAQFLAAAMKQEDPRAILASASQVGKDTAPLLAARLGISLVADATGVELLPGGELEAKRPVYAGKAFVTNRFTQPPYFITLRPNVFSAGTPDTGRSCAVEALQVPLTGEALLAKVREVVKAAKQKVDLTEAEIIISGGRGMKGPENYGILEELAELLGGVVGASRASVDAGWRPHSDQVGQTGKTVTPTLYIACGISGAIQHLAGMGSSKFIVAINKDPEAPIFKVADYGIVGDLFEVVPALTAEFKRVLKK